MQVILAQPRGLRVGVVRVIDALRKLAPVEVTELDGAKETIEFRLPPQLRDVALAAQPAE